MTTNSSTDQIIQTINEKVQHIFGDKLVGSYLFGSLTYGDFRPESSDIDLMFVLRTAADSNELTSLKKMHQDIEAAFPIWAKRVESSYTPMEMLTTKQPPEHPRPYYGERIFYEEAPYGNEWIINLYLLYEHGKALFGPSFRELTPAIDIADVQAACIRDLSQEWEPKLREPEWLDNSHYQSYLVLNLCRILNTVLHATALSKKQSAAAIKNRFPEWSDVIESAEHWSYGQEMERQSETLEFLKFVILEVEKEFPKIS